VIVNSVSIIMTSRHSYTDDRNKKNDNSNRPISAVPQALEAGQNTPGLLSCVCSFELNHSHLLLYSSVILVSYALVTILCGRVFTGPDKVVTAFAFGLCTCIELSTLVGTFLCHCQPVFIQTE